MALIAVGFVLRAANILWGVPALRYVGYYHPDEVKTWSSAVAFPESYLGSTNYYYGTALQYAVGLLLLPAKLILVGGFDTNPVHELVVILVFRGVNVLLGTATIPLIYYLGRRIGSEQAGLIGAALFSVAFAPTINSALTTLDVPMAFFAMAGLVQLDRATSSLSTRSFVVLSLIAGMLLATKITGGLFLLVAAGALVWRLLLSPAAARGVSIQRKCGWIALTLAVAFALFAITTPHVFLDPNEYFRFMRDQKQAWYDQAQDDLGRMLSSGWSATSVAIGLPTAILAVAGIGLAMSDKFQQATIAVVYVAANYVFWRGYLIPRFVIPVAPMLCLFAALPLAQLRAAKMRAANVCGGALLTVAFGWSAAFSALGCIEKWSDPRTAAARFIDEHLEPGVSIGIATDHNGQWVEHDWRYPLIDFRGKFVNAPPTSRPEYLVTTSLEMETMRPALSSPQLHPGYRWKAAPADRWYKNEPPKPELFALFDDLLSERTYSPFAVFKTPVNVPIDGGCPAVLVYRRTTRNR